jgi:FKBP-type peptidyl-prolyl cis-trans isomerase
MRLAITTCAVALSLLVGVQEATEVYADDKGKKGGKVETTSSGLSYQDSVVGTGAEAQKGKLVFVHYTGWLDENGAKGKKFDSSRDRGTPFKFALGAGMVIAGWDEGVSGMKVGGQRTLMIPPELGYGARGAGGVIPANSKLIFDVELIDVK